MGLLLIDNQFLPQVTTFARCAKEQIDISTFKAEITTKARGEKLKQFFELLRDKKWSGIKIRFLINWNTERRSCPKTNLYAAREMRKWGIDIRIIPNNRCCHAKIIIFDQKCAIIGSHNLSVKSCHNNFEISHVEYAYPEVELLQGVFNKLFSKSKKFKD